MFVSTKNLFSDVKQMLKSFDSAGLINDSDLWRWTAYMNQQIGTTSSKQRSILISVENHKAVLPVDFSYLYAVYLCNVECDTGPSTYKAYLGNTMTYSIKDWYSTMCYDKCDVCVDNNEYYVHRTFTKDIIAPSKCILSVRVPLEIDKEITKQRCHECCVNFSCKCDYKFNIEDGVIYTNFEQGNINLEYFGLAIDDEGYPEVIDEPIILQSIEDYLIYKTFQQLWYNGEAEVQNRMQFAEQKHIQSMKDMLYFVKLPTWKSLVDYSKKRKKYLDIFNLESNSDYKDARIQHSTQRTQFRR
jgi:hypothetical protein